jgi:predicted peptidase
VCKATATPAENLSLKEGLFDKTIERRVRLRYLLYLPQDYGRTGVRWPLILYLHGGMGRGNDFAKMAWYPLPRLLREPGHQLPFVVLMPQCPGNDNWGDPEALLALLDEICATHAVDPDRIYLAGYSMGGAGVLRLAFAHPDRFAAVAVMSGFADTSWAPRLKGIAMWFFHGGRDDRVPVRESVEMVKALKAEGADVRFSLDPNGAHPPPGDEDHLRLSEWFLTHRRAGPGTPGDITKPGGEPSQQQNERMQLTKPAPATEHSSSSEVPCGL